MGLASINVARVVYLLMCELAGVLIALSTKDNPDFVIPVSAGLLGGLVVAVFFIFVESLMKGFTLRGFSTATFGILVGLLCAWLLTRVGVDDLIAQGFGLEQDTADAVQLIANVTIFGSLGFLGAALALRSSREDFAFIIPYVRFRSDSLGGRPLLLDSSALSDGRLKKLIVSGFLPSNLVVPDFVLENLRKQAESSEKFEAKAAGRALKMLAEIKDDPTIELQVHDSRRLDHANEGHDERLLEVAQLLGARLFTTDDALLQLARVQSVTVLSLTELEASILPELTVGARLSVPLVRTGKDSQAIGYLADGSMIVVNGGVELVGTTPEVRVTSLLEKEQGTMVFAELAKPRSDRALDL